MLDMPPNSIARIVAALILSIGAMALLVWAAFRLANQRTAKAIAAARRQEAESADALRRAYHLNSLRSSVRTPTNPPSMRRDLGPGLRPHPLRRNREAHLSGTTTSGE